MSRFPFVAMLSLAMPATACVSDQPEPPTTEVTRQAIDALTQTATLGAPFSTPPAPGFAAGGSQDSVEQAVATGLGDPSCVAFTWVGLSATVRFDHCAANGHTLDGALTLSLQLAPLTIRLDLDQLSYDSQRVDGFASVSWPNGVTTIASDLTRSSGNATMHSTSSLALRWQSPGLIADGTLELDAGTWTHEIAASSVTWVTGNCAPSSGTLQFSNNLDDVVVRFLATTPTTGIVEIRVNELPPVQLAVLPPCS